MKQTLYDGSYVSVPTHQMCISRQSIVDRCLRFITTEQVQQKGGMR